MIPFDSGSKPPEKSFSGEVPGDMIWDLTNSDEDESDLMAKFQIGEERVEEVMQELYQEITCFGVGDTHAPPPQDPSPKSFPPQPSSSDPVGLQGESCGAALSAEASSVMAGIELVAPAPSSSAGNLEAKKAKQAVVRGGRDLTVETVGMKMDGCDDSDDGGDESDQWVSKVLGWGPMDLEEEWDMSK